MERMNGKLPKESRRLKKNYFIHTYADWGSSVIRMIFSLCSPPPTSLIARAVCRSGGEFRSLNHHSRAHHHHHRKKKIAQSFEFNILGKSYESTRREDGMREDEEDVMMGRKRKKKKRNVNMWAEWYDVGGVCRRCFRCTAARLFTWTFVGKNWVTQLNSAELLQQQNLFFFTPVEYEYNVELLKFFVSLCSVFRFRLHEHTDHVYKTDDVRPFRWSNKN